MKKIFTFAVAVMASVAMMAADKIYALSEMSVSGNTYTSADFSGEKAKNNNIYVELPSASVSGTIAFWGQSDKTDRFLYIYGTNGTVKDTERPITMLSAGDTINYTSADVIINNEKPYLLFSTGDDFKFIKFEYTAEGIAPVTSPVTTVTVSGPTEAYVGEKVSLKATFDVTPDTIWWTDKFGVSLDCNKASLDFTPAAEGSFTFVAWAQNQHNVSPAASEVHTIAATVKPAAVACTNLIPAASGDALNVGDEVALNAMSEGGKIYVAGMKTAGTSIAYNTLGLQLGGGGADSIRVELNNLIQEGTEITLNMVAGGTSARGLNILALDKSSIYQAKWTPSATGEENSITYTVPAGSKLIGQSKFLLQRNNTVYLASVVVANCGESIGGGEVDTDPVLAVNPESIALNATAALPNPSANITFSGKNLTPGTYNLTIPNLAGLTITPTSVTVGEDGKLNAQVAISYESAVEVAAASTTIGLTIGELSESATINYSAVLAKNYMSSVNIEQLVVANGTGYNIQGALTAANIEYASINALDSLNDSKGAARNEAYLGMKFKTSGAYIAGWLQASKTLRVKFGNLPAAVKVTLNGAAAADHTTGIFEYTATEDTYVKLATSSSSTVVIKQIMVDEPIANVMYNITYAAAENGSVSGWTVAFPGEDVELTFAPAEGYIVMNCTVNGVEIHQSAPGAAITFTMPEEAVTVNAVFALPTDIDNTEEAVKAVKFFKNGQLMIMKNGVKYNAQGARVL